MSQRGRRKTSQLWNFFSVVDHEFATCDVCQQKLSYRTSISNLKKHLRKQHHTLLNKCDGSFLGIGKRLSPVEDGEIEEDLSDEIDAKKEADENQVPVIVEFIQSQETVETEKNLSPPQSEYKSDAGFSSPPKQRTIAEAYKCLCRSVCSDKLPGCTKERHASEIREQHLRDSLQMERELKRKILETELEMKREELKFKKNLYRIQLEHEAKASSLKLKVLERDLSL